MKTIGLIFWWIGYILFCFIVLPSAMAVPLIGAYYLGRITWPIINAITGA